LCLIDWIFHMATNVQSHLESQVLLYLKIMTLNFVKALSKVHNHQFIAFPGQDLGLSFMIS